MVKVWQCVGAIACGGSGIATLTVLFLLSIQSPSCACGDTKGIHLRTLHRAQQAAYTEKGRFLNQSELETFSQISLSMISREAYRYRTELDDSGAIVFGYATPYTRYFQPKLGPFNGSPRPTYHSAVSALTFDVDNDQFKGVICTSSEPSGQPLPVPTYTDNGFDCPVSTDTTAHP